MVERMWTYPELKFIAVHQFKLDGQTLANEVNRKFHDGERIRTAVEIEKIKNAKTIFNKGQAR